MPPPKTVSTMMDDIMGTRHKEEELGRITQNVTTAIHTETQCTLSPELQYNLYNHYSHTTQLSLPQPRPTFPFQLPLPADLDTPCPETDDAPADDYADYYTLSLPLGPQSRLACVVFCVVVVVIYCYCYYCSCCSYKPSKLSCPVPSHHSWLCPDS